MVGTATGYRHIVRDSEGRLRVLPSQYKLNMLIRDHVHRRMGARALIKAHPELTLGQAHEVLAFYYDHQLEIDAELLAEDHNADQIIAQIDALQGESPLKRELRSGKRQG